MVIKQRAIQAEDKQERYDAILDAAERLLLRSPERSANMADVADEAELAKGTVYLYFPSKEELLLALHERNIDAFFSRLIELLEADASVELRPRFRADSSDDDRATTVPSAGQPVLGADGPESSGRRGARVHGAYGWTLATSRRRLERHFRALRAGDGLVLLRNSYALILGLWQTAGRGGWFRGQEHSVPASVTADWNYADELEQALRALWAGTFERGSPRNAR